MNYLISGIATFALALFTLPLHADADRIEAQVRGNLLGSCGFDQGRDVIYSMGDVRALDMPSVGSPTEWVERSIVTSGCFGVERIIMTFNAASANADGHPELFYASGGSGGVAIEAQTAGGTAIFPNDQNGLVWKPSEDGDSYGVRIRYVRIGDIKAGEANACIVVIMRFE
ncbi:type 1 fimbria pilin [Luteibacter sp. Sphag1AF]|uniref:fimbrial protein n=1 Tax=Luteibacter sp. Sphag1AF TaxID=2587031 RepID=UPI00160CB67B|nr:type 1 fimbrial protein [Luteibacter sp. Sphag1AF]MBB3227640.1 type 1 fimbria pilin [Luteibacter sp. Sphag1AF]